MRILIGLGLMVAGTLLVIFSRPLYDNMGRFPWAERVFGGGGTLTLLRLIGAAGILLGLFIWTGLFDLIFGGIIRTLFGGFERVPQ